MMKPITPAFPVFTALCCKCGRKTTSNVAATGEKAFQYVGWCCQNDETREEVLLAFNHAFAKMSKAQRHQVRVTLFGISETRKIEEREHVQGFKS